MKNKYLEKSYVRAIVNIGKKNHGSLAIIIPIKYVNKLGLQPGQKMRVKLIGKHLGVFVIGDIK